MAIESVIGGVAGMLTAPLQNHYNKKSAEQNFEYSKALNEQQFGYQQQLQKEQNDFNVDMWNKTNEYNSAAAQVQRYRDAGLNVGMMMSGQGAGQAQQLTSANPGVPGSSNFSGMQAADYQNSILSGMQTGIQVKQLENENTKLDIEKQDLDLRKREQANRDKKTQSDIDLNAMLGLESGSKYHLNKKNERWLGQQLKESEQRVVESQERVKEIIANVEWLKAKASNEKKQGDWIGYRETTERMNAITNRMNADTNKAVQKVQEKLADADIKLKDAQTLGTMIHAMSEGKDVELKGVELKYADSNAKADLEIKQGQVRIINVDADVAELTKYARVVDAYIQTVDHVAQATSDAVGAVLDFTTYGASKMLREGAPRLQNSQSRFFGAGARSNNYSTMQRQMQDIGTYTLGKSSSAVSISSTRNPNMFQLGF